MSNFCVTGIGYGKPNIFTLQTYKANINNSIIYNFLGKLKIMYQCLKPFIVKGGGHLILSSHLFAFVITDHIFDRI